MIRYKHLVLRLLIIQSISIISAFTIALPGSTQTIDPKPTSADVLNWLPPSIEELAVATQPPRKSYQEFFKSSSLNLCLLPLLPDRLLRDLDLITFQGDSRCRDNLDISGAWNINLDLDDLPRFRGRHKVELHSALGKIYGCFYVDERTIFRMEGKETVPGRITFTLPIEKNKLWIQFAADIKPQQLVGTYSRFDRDKSNGHLNKTVGQWSAEQISQEGCWTKDIAFCVKGRGKPKSAENGNNSVFEECQVILLSRPIHFDLKKLASRCYSCATHEIVVRHENWQGGLDYYLAQPSPNVLLVATSEDYINTTIQRMVSKAADTSMASSLPEWRHVSQKSAYYVIRHHSPSKDSSSSYHRLKVFFGLPLEGDSAVGLTFSQDTYTPAFIQLYYLSKGTKGTEELVAYLRGKNRSNNFVKIEAVGNDCSKIRVSPSNDEERRAVLYFFQVTLGLL